jgi:hypothetical protein
MTDVLIKGWGWLDIETYPETHLTSHEEIRVIQQIPPEVGREAWHTFASDP